MDRHFEDYITNKTSDTIDEKIHNNRDFEKSLKFVRNCLQKEYLEFDVLLTLSVWLHTRNDVILW